MRVKNVECSWYDFLRNFSLLVIVGIAAYAAIKLGAAIFGHGA